jgi:tetratricopeptide (TPR) repeat protein
MIEARNHPRSARSLYQLGATYFDWMRANPLLRAEYYPRARELFERAPTLDEYNPSGLFALIHLNGLAGLPPEQRWLDELGKRLRERAFAQFVGTQLTNLNQCHQLGHCATLSNEQLRSLFDAALANPTLRDWMRARLLADAATHALYAQDVQAALGYARAAVEYEPGHPQHHLNLASLLFQAGQIAEARQELAQVERMPLTTRQRERFASVQAAIAPAQVIEQEGP